MTDYAAIGRKKLLEIDGEAGVKVGETLNRTCPDLVRYLVEYSFGEIYAREVFPQDCRRAFELGVRLAKAEKTS